MRAKRLLLLALFLPLISFIMPANSAFAASPDTLYVTNAGNGNGVILADGINCGSDCSETYSYFFFPPTKTVSYTVSTDSYFAGWTGDCSGTGSCSVRMSENKNVTATFYKYNYTITASAGTGGNINPSGTVSVPRGNSQTFNIAPNVGYSIDTVTVDGNTKGAIATFTFDNVTEDHTISATFSPETYTITATKEGSGTISPAGISSVDYNGDLTYTIAPATPGYHIHDVLVDGTSVGAVSSYPFSSVIANRTIHAIFAPDMFTITGSAGTTATPGSLNGCSNGTGGSISPLGETQVPFGGSQTYTGSIASGYHLDQIYRDGSGIGTIEADGSYTFSDVDANHSITACFLLNTYTITLDAGAGGSITGDTTVSHDSDNTYQIEADTGYHIVEVRLDGTVVASTPTSPYPYYLNDVQTDHTISATFALNTYTITVTQGSDGSISPDPAPAVPYDGSQSFSIIPDTGFETATLLVDGIPQPAADIYTFENVIDDHSFSATFTAASHIITPTATAGGSISPAAQATVLHHDSTSFSITPDTGFYITDVLVDATSVGPVDSYEFLDVTSAHNIHATFTAGHVIEFSQRGNGTIEVATPYTIDVLNDRVILPSGSTLPAVFTLTGTDGDFLTEVVLDSTLQSPPTSPLSIPVVTTNHTLDVKFGVGFTITVNPVTNGSISPGTKDVSPGSTPTYTITPAWGYRVSDVQVDGGSVTCEPLPAPDTTNGCTYTFPPVDDTHTLYATFQPGYVITPTAGSNGSITPADTQIIPAGGSQTFSFSPDNGYKIASITVDGVEQSITTSYTFTNVYSNRSIAVTFIEDSYTITASKQGNGTIKTGGVDAVGEHSVTFSDSLSFAIEATSPGYHIYTVMVDGESKGDVATWEFPSIDTNHSIQAIFAPDEFDIIASIYTDGVAGGAGGTIDPSGTSTVPYGGSQTYTGSIASGYHLDHIEIDGEDIGTIEEDGSYTFSDVGIAPDTGNHTIEAFFVSNTYTINASARTGGTITDPGETTVTHGDDKSYTVKASEGYTIKEVTINGATTVAPESPYDVEFTSISGDIDIAATFSPILFNITAESGANGTIYPPGTAGVTQVTYGSSQTYTMLEDTGYHVDDVRVNAVSQGALTSYTFTDIQADAHIYVTFDTGNIISATAGANGSISPAGDVIVNQEDPQTFTFSPLAGYHVADVVVDGISMGPWDSYTFSDVRARHTISVTFINTYTISITSEGAGTITPPGPEVAVIAGTSQSFSIAATNGGEDITALFIDGALVGAYDNYPFDSVNEDHTLHVIFGTPYTIHATSGDNGSISPEGDVHVEPLGSQAFSVKAATGYSIADLLVDDKSVDPVSSHQFDTVHSDHWIEASFTQNSYTITASADTGGSIDPEGSVPVMGGDMMGFDVNPGAGYAYGPVTGTCGGTLNTQARGLSFFTNPVSQDCTVEATFVPDEDHHTVTSSTGTGGAISPLGDQGVADGGVITFELTPEDGYAIGPVGGTCGGTLNTMTGTFTTFAIYEDCTVEASFVDDSGSSTRYTVSAAAGIGGNIFEEGHQDVAEGEVLSFALLPANGYAIGPVTGTCSGTMDTQTKLFTSNPVTADCTVVANFVTDDVPVDRNTVTSSATTGGMITPLGDQNVADGGIITFIVQTEPGFAFGPVTGTCGGTFNTISKTFTTNLINQDCTVEATFIDNGRSHHLVTPSVDTNWPGGSIAPASAQVVAEGGVITFNLFPEPGSAIRAVEGTCGGRLDRMSNSFTTDAVTQPCEVIASFVSDTPATRHTVTSSAGAGGNIHLAGNQEIAHGGVLTFAILPMDGYNMGPMSGTCGGYLNSQTKLFTTHPVTQDCSVKATFVAQSSSSYTVTSSAGTGGAITPEGTQSVVQGGVTSFQLLPDNGYALGPVLGSCGGTLDTRAQIFTIFGVSQDCTVEATFVDTSVTDYIVTASAGVGGSINPDGAQTVNEGGVITFQLLPEQGFAVGPVNGSCTGTLNTQAKIFTTEAISGDCSVEATFVDATGITFAITTSVVGPGGSIAPDEYPAVAENGVVSFRLHPAPHYSVGSVAGCNGTLSGKTYLTGEITEPCTVVAPFVRNNYLLTVTKTGTGGDFGTISIDQTPDLICVNHVGTGTYAGTVVLTAPEGSARFVDWTGCTSATGSECTVNMNGDQAVSAEFYYFPWPMFMPAITGAGL